MKNSLILSVSAIVCLFAFSCEEVVDLGIEEDQSRLAVVCNFQPDSFFTAVVTQSRSALSSDSFRTIENAVVGIYEDENLLEELTPTFDLVLGKTVYKSRRIKPEVGVPYTIWVKALGFDDVMGMDALPPPVAISEFSISDIVARFNGPNRNLLTYRFRVRVTFEDPPNEINFYHLNFYYEDVRLQQTGDDTLVNRTGYRTFVNLANTDNDNPFLLHYSDGVLIDDQSTDGRRLTYEFEARTLPIPTRNLFDRLFVELRSTSSAYHWFHTSLTRQTLQTDTTFAEPVILFNNIENGYGIFGGYSVARDSVMIE